MEKKNNYITPNVEVLNIEPEGVFCQSGETTYPGATHEGWTEEDW